MGLFCVNVHFKTADDKALSTALARRKVTNTRVLPAKKGWVTLYEERASQQDDERIRELAGGLSQDLKVVAIAFMVHDSDIACYWLYDNGQLLDEYNSCPDYFESGGGGGPSGGQTDVLVRYCRPGTRAEDLAAVLSEEVVFAEGIIEKLADALGIDAERALSDYGDGDGPDGDDEDDEDDDGDGDDDGPGGAGNIKRIQAMMASRMGQMFGGAQAGAPVDPQAQALVDAATRGDDAEINRLLAAGVAIDVQAPAPLPVNEALQGLGVAPPGGMPKVPMSPLIAALSHKRQAATKLLLERGADCNAPHAMFGPPIHVAVGAGDPVLVRLLIDHGADVNAKNAHRQTPLTILAATRASYDRVAQAQAMMKASGMKVPDALVRLSQVKMPTEGWDACEKLLKSHDAL